MFGHKAQFDRVIYAYARPIHKARASAVELSNTQACSVIISQHYSSQHSEALKAHILRQYFASA
jgi:hypothetical protein